MNPLIALLGLSLLIYSTLYHQIYLIAYILLIVLYIVLTQRNKLNKYNNKTRKMLIAAWNGPSNPNIYINYVWECEKALQFINKYK